MYSLCHVCPPAAGGVAVAAGLRGWMSSGTLWHRPDWQGGAGWDPPGLPYEAGANRSSHSAQASRCVCWGACCGDRGVRSPVLTVTVCLASLQGQRRAEAALRGGAVAWGPPSGDTGKALSRAAGYRVYVYSGVLRR